jgi:hypothetical protein
MFTLTSSILGLFEGLPADGAMIAVSWQVPWLMIGE